MKKKILTMAFAVAASFGIYASAQSKNVDNSASAKTEQAQIKGDNKMARPHRFTDFAFEGILLDIPQQARMDSLNAAMKAQADERRAEKPERVDGDRDRGPRPMGRNPQVRRDYVAKVKEILTPEQYTMFLENIVLMPENAGAQPGQNRGMRPDRGSQGMDKDRAHRDHKGMRHGDRRDMQKGDKAKAQSAETSQAQQK